MSSENENHDLLKSMRFEGIINLVICVPGFFISCLIFLFVYNISVNGIMGSSPDRTIIDAIRKEPVTILYFLGNIFFTIATVFGIYYGTRILRESDQSDSVYIKSTTQSGMLMWIFIAMGCVFVFTFIAYNLIKFNL